MRKLNFIIFMGIMVLGTSCKKYFDINQDPNRATAPAATAELILPLALTATASDLNGFNSYGMQLGGYGANAGGFGGFGTAISYNFSSNDYSGLWNNTYDNLEDYYTIITKTKDKPTYKYFEAVARIMQAHDFQLLVDTYNDVPYTDALKGAANLTPAYSDAKVIYKDLADQLDVAIGLINAGNTTVGAVPLGTSDVIFGGDVTKWKQFANTLKLRIILRANGKVTFSNTTFSADGFLAADALVNPGYTRDNGKQNPKWDNWAYGYTGTDAGKAWMPNTFVFSFYDGTKLSDPYRGANVYYQFPKTGTNRLGVENNSVVASPSGNFWYTGFNRKGASAVDTTGVLKGPGAGFPVITAAESYFLQSEAAVRGILAGGDPAALFNSGISASFNYLYTMADGKTIHGDPAGDLAKYKTDNVGSPLVNFTLAVTADQKIEAIITQKYIALNFVNSNEGWNEFRRTHYPKISSAANASGTATFASSVSESTRPDRLPTRVLYPSSEGAYNGTNVPKGISPFGSLIFWAL
ncbi:SusD-like starch-binding protein associating with outer membrane [Chitinophaga niastensis]|uniref:SusD-like starch-binding protein associating with outer membrane n=1 Tax=Chitinophaga niastensis TaxID=536980 RepID=A0A2P8HDB1_CHINA|nr:SusD/RagB family nutrient-binding outer membrane lipoprotein [Chitinophaga niastensis]PSL44210.1 SusD-like starch-binding protein associating with outer membrane [Chitinophaga niastensis]